MKKQTCRTALTFAFSLAVLSVSGAPATAQDNPVGFEISHHHIGISVANAEESAARYNKMLGFEVVTRMNQGNGMRVVHIERDNSGNGFELIQYKHQ